MKYKRLFYAILFGLIFNHAFGQKSNFCKTITKREDSVILSLLVKYFPDDSVSYNNLSMNDNEIKKHYGYLSYRMLLDKKTEIRILNFGTFSEHNPKFMLLEIISDGNTEESFVLGKDKLESDLRLIERLFSSYLTVIKEKSKLEIMEIFLQTRLGVLQTKCYIH